MTTLEKLVEGATKIKLAPPKPKYMEPILMSTEEGIRSDSFQTVMRSLKRRLNDSAWTVVYKSLVVVHIMIREGAGNVTLDYLKNHMDFFIIPIGENGKFIDNGGSIRQIRSYGNYLLSRAREFGRSQHDFIKETKKPFGGWEIDDKTSILRDLSIEKGLLRETESVENQIIALLKCKFKESEVNNDLIILSFRMLTGDLISLYQTLNEGVLNILEHFFELSKPDAERAFKIYHVFTKLTDQVVSFLRIAKHLEKVTKCKVPTIKHAQTSLSDSLQDYIDDPNFDITRRQYLAERDYLKSKKKSSSSSSESVNNQNKKNADQKSKQIQEQQKQQQVPIQAFEQEVAVPTAQPLQVQIPVFTPVLNTGFNPFTNFQPIQTLEPQFTNQAVQQPALPVEQQFTNHQIQQFTPPVQTQTIQQNDQQFTNQPVQPFGSPIKQQFLNQTLPQFTNQPSQIPLPQIQQQHTLHYTAPNGFSTLPQISEIPRSATTNDQLGQTNSLLSSPSVKHAFTVSNGHNPFGLQHNSTGSNNPFAANTSFESEVTPSVKPNRLSKAKTGTNPFRLETETTPADRVPTGPVQPLQPHFTAGGLENLQTIPVFPETLRDTQVKSINPFSQQPTGHQLPQQQNFSYNQQPYTGEVNMQQQQFSNQTSVNQSTAFSQQQNPVFTHQFTGMNQQTTGFPQQPPNANFNNQQFNQELYNNPSIVYNGPNLMN